MEGKLSQARAGCVDRAFEIHWDRIALMERNRTRTKRHSLFSEAACIPRLQPAAKSTARLAAHTDYDTVSELILDNYGAGGVRAMVTSPS
jgi:hypothetical protein